MAVPRMTSAKAVATLRACIESGQIILTTHATKEMLNDRISRVELFRVLSMGQIFKPAEQQLKTGEWKYRIESNVIGRPVAAVFKFAKIDQAVVITVFEVKG